MAIRKVLIIYTGGTIGMKQSPKGYTPAKGWMEQQLRTIYAFQDPQAPPRTTPPSKSGTRIYYDIIEYDPLLDSANMEVHHWVKIAREIEQNYDQYDGFVVLHGTDTMSYTSSALSFMLVNLRKTVVITGSQIPLSEVRNDAVNNLLGALTMAGLYDIPEVCLYFDNQLFRGNRTQKIDSSGLGAFQSSNLPPLAKIGIDIDVAWHLTLPTPVRPLRLRRIKEQNVASLRLFPGITTSLLEKFLQPPLRGVVLETYGAGNVPASRKDFVAVLERAIARGVIVVNCTQCVKGSVSAEYETGSVLNQIGVCSGYDMTPEAALTKLAYLLSQDDLSLKQVKENIGKNLRGELSNQQKERFSFQEQSFVETVARVITQGGEFGVSSQISKTIFPVLSCSAAARGDVEALERMMSSQFSIDTGDYDGRTALHLASAEGQSSVVEFLISKGANVHVVDRWGVGPLGDAIQNQHDAVIEKLVAAGARVQSKEIVAQMCQAAADGNLLYLQRLVKAGGDISTGDYDGRTPLHLAAACNQLKVAQYLIKQGADINALDRFGGRPFDDAERNGLEEMKALVRP